MMWLRNGGGRQLENRGRVGSQVVADCHVGAGVHATTFHVTAFHTTLFHAAALGELVAVWRLESSRSQERVELRAVSLP